MKNLSEFLSYISDETDTGCWLWTGPTDFGYGVFNRRRTHRIAYELQNGKIPKGAHICHHCDVKTCVNPSHLYAGDHKQNMQDSARRAGGPPGTRFIVLPASNRKTKRDKIEEYNDMHVDIEEFLGFGQ